MIVGFFGFQRSGKTALSMYLARFLQENYGNEIYTNLDSFGTVNEIEKITDIPIDRKPKSLLWDEIHFSLDSRLFNKNINFTPFVSTLGKQKILMMFTCPTPDLVDIRIRKQMSYMVLCKGDDDNIYYQVIDLQRENKSKIFSFAKSKQLFDFLSYDSDLVVPNTIECDLEEFVKLSKTTLSTNSLSLSLSL